MADQSNSKEYWASQTETSTHGSSNFVKHGPKQSLFFDPILSEIAPETSFLEVGCNAGVNCNFLWEKGFTNVHGFDISEVAISSTMKNELPHLYETTNFKSGDAINVIKEYDDNSFDVVFSKGTMIHIHKEEVREVLREMCRVSRRFILFFEDEILRLNLDFEMRSNFYHPYYKRRYIKGDKWFKNPMFPKNHSFDSSFKTVSYYIKEANK